MNAPQPSDETLVKRLLPTLNDDPADRAVAWQEWYASRGEAALLGFIRTKNNSAEPDADILQEAMLTAYVELERGRYQPRAGIPLTAYVKGIARNKIREARRQHQRLVPLDESLESLLEHEQPPLETVVERREQGQAIEVGLARLSQSRQQVLQGYLTGRSTTEIADALDMTEALVRQHKSRGLRRLRQMSIFSTDRF